MHNHPSTSAEVARYALIAIAIGALGVSPPTRADGITVVSPNGGETWIAGDLGIIEWELSGGTSDVVDIYVMQGAEIVAQFDDYSDVWNQFVWEICEVTQAGSDFVVVIEGEFDGTPVSDQSDGPFSIAVPELTLTAPDGGELLQGGTAELVTWNSVDPFGYVRVWLEQTGETDRMLGMAPMDAEAFVWHVDSCLVGSDFSIRVDRASRCGILPGDASDMPISISPVGPQPTLAVTSPNGGEVFAADTVQTITWQSTDPSGSVDLWLTDGVVRFDLIGTAPMADGQFEWVVPHCAGAGTSYKVIAAWSNENIRLEDTSDAAFEITALPSEPEIVIDSPAPGTVWSAGTVQTISWTSNFSHGDVAVDLLFDDGWNLHLGQVPVMDGALSWEICPGIGDSSAYAIRVQASGCGTGDTSEAFEIADSATPTLTLTSPVGGEVWLAGVPYWVTWESENLYGDVDLYFPNDGWFHSGYTRVPVEDGQYLWTIPSTLGGGETAGVWIYSYECGQVLYQRSGTVTIVTGATTPADSDADGDVDLLDLAGLQRAFTGRTPATLEPWVDVFDYEPDGDVDLDDFDLAADLVTGP